MRAITIRNSSQPEPAFQIPDASTRDDIAEALQLLTDAGLDVEVVEVVAATTVAEFRARVASFAARGGSRGLPWPP